MCLLCDSNTTTLNATTKSPLWTRYNDGFICHKCYSKTIGNKRQTKEYRKKYNDMSNPRLMLFKKRMILLEERNKKGQCDICGKKVGDSFINYKGMLDIIKRTHTHHEKYHDDDVLRDTIEVCGSCHMKETWRLNGNIRQK